MPKLQHAMWSPEAQGCEQRRRLAERHRARRPGGGRPAPRPPPHPDNYNQSSPRGLRPLSGVLQPACVGGSKNDKVLQTQEEAMNGLFKNVSGLAEPGHLTNSLARIQASLGGQHETSKMAPLKAVACAVTSLRWPPDTRRHTEGTVQQRHSPIVRKKCWSSTTYTTPMTSSDDLWSWRRSSQLEKITKYKKNVSGNMYDD